MSWTNRAGDPEFGVVVDRAKALFERICPGLPFLPSTDDDTPDSAPAPEGEAEAEPAEVAPTTAAEGAPAAPPME